MCWSVTNKVISSLSSRERSLIAPHLRRFELIPGDVLNAPPKDVSHVYFPGSGLLTIVVVFADGKLAEAAVAESNIVGASALFGDGTAFNQVLGVASGVVDRIEVGILRRLVRESEPLREVLVRHSQALAAQSVQIAGCNAVHALEARLCRWLLQCRDLVSADKLPFTQDLMSSMLGVYRPSLTHVLRKLESAQLVSVSRGKICILDAEALHERACECYAVIRERLQNVEAPPDRLFRKSLLAV